MYDSGMKVPEDVIICWPDDNFGYLRRLPNDEERKRPGGSGVYYHIQWLNGATTAYTWLNTMPLPLMATEMHKAWRHGADKLWVVNVGDIKPGEIGMEYFLDMAWDPDRRRPDHTRAFLEEWAARDLDEWRIELRRRLPLSAAYVRWNAVSGNGLDVAVAWAEAGTTGADPICDELASAGGRVPAGYRCYRARVLP